MEFSEHCMDCIFQVTARTPGTPFVDCIALVVVEALANTPNAARPEFAVVTAVEFLGDCKDDERLG